MRPTTRSPSTTRGPTVARGSWCRRREPRRGLAAPPRSRVRDRTIGRVQALGRRRWKKAAGYHRQARVENAVFRYKSIIGPGLRARTTRRAGDRSAPRVPRAESDDRARSARVLPHRSLRGRGYGKCPPQYAILQQRRSTSATPDRSGPAPLLRWSKVSSKADRPGHTPDVRQGRPVRTTVIGLLDPGGGSPNSRRGCRRDGSDGGCRHLDAYRMRLPAALCRFLQPPS